ncbi:MAG TPA: exodeoxyribonuclease III [Candidatus Pacearchaeota archaeon]|nr:exodeoxyribonuclease [bacterium BMS3Abin04]HDK42124.1 exodeoxyribonuclease III [Candidatus Pacearchaeota archaeon]
MKKLTLLSWNVNGIRAVAKKGFHEWLKQTDPDILCIQETKAWEEQLDKSLTNIKDYHSYFAEAYKKGYSGVAVYSKEKPISVKKGIGIEEFNREGRILIAEYPEFLLFNIYFPNGKARAERLKYKLDFYEAFQKHVVKLKKQGKRIIICGDVNTAHKEIDLARPKPNSKVSGFLPEERAWMDRFFTEGFIDTLRMFNNNPEVYTWWDVMTRARDRNVGWRIDYFFVSDNLKDNVTDAFTLPNVMGSDHCPVGIEIKI